MKVTYDKEADAMYIKLTDEKFSKAKIVDPKTILNLDKDGNVIGVELLSVSKRISNPLSQIVVETYPARE